jgi:hypothetical protein
MTATTPLAGITASMPPTRVHLSCVEAFAQVYAASRQRLAGVSGAGRRVGPHSHDHHFPRVCVSMLRRTWGRHTGLPLPAFGRTRWRGALCVRPIEAWDNTMTHTHVPAAASKAQIGMLYCPSFSTLKAYIY